MQPFQKRQATEKFAASERGAYKKPYGAFHSTVLVFPNKYTLGMSNLGYQIIYRMINERDDFLCDRYFTDTPFTIENLRQLTEFEIIFFSVPFEMDYPQIIKMLQDTKIPPLAAERNKHHPIVVVGGISVLVNPLPIADYVDVIIPDEAECVMDEFLDIYVESGDRKDFFEQLREKDYIIPALMSDEEIFERIKNRKFLETLTGTDAISQIYTPLTEFGNMCLIEISRGCTYACPFCFVGSVLKPYRIRHFDDIKQMIDKGAKFTNSMGFISSAVCSHPDIEKICDYCGERGYVPSFSSLRLEQLSTKVIDSLVKGGQTMLTIAPEAGTERLRRLLKKPTPDSLILDKVRYALTAGIINIKLYFMIDLPDETAEDLEGIAKLTEKIYNEMRTVAKDSKKIGDIILNIGIFVPKPHTPFEQHTMSDIKTLKKKIKFVQKGLSIIPNVRYTFSTPQEAIEQFEIGGGGRGKI